MSTRPPTRPGRSRVVAALVASAALALAGCAGDDVPAASAPAPPAAPPAPDATDPPADEATVAWTGTVCSSVAPVVETLRSPPPVDFTNAEATRDAYQAYVDATLQETEEARRQVEAAGPPPVEGGEELAQEVRGQIDDLIEDLNEARAQLERADPNDLGAIGQAVGAVGNMMGSVGNSAQTIAQLRVDPRLDSAFDRAPECQQLTATGEPS